MLGCSSKALIVRLTGLAILGHVQSRSCSKIAEAEAAVSVNEKKWLVMHMHVQLQLDEPVSQLQMLVQIKVPVEAAGLDPGCCARSPLLMQLQGWPAVEG
jgi:hypothetical protein